MIVTSHQAWSHSGCHEKLSFKSFPILCRFTPRQMLACLCALKSVSVKTGLLFEEPHDL